MLAVAISLDIHGADGVPIVLVAFAIKFPVIVPPFVGNAVDVNVMSVAVLDIANAAPTTFKFFGRILSTYPLVAASVDTVGSPSPVIRFSLIATSLANVTLEDLSRAMICLSVIKFVKIEFDVNAIIFKRFFFILYIKPDNLHDACFPTPFDYRNSIAQHVSFGHGWMSRS